MLRWALAIVVLLGLQLMPREALAVQVTTRGDAYQACMAHVASRNSVYTDYICHPDSDSEPNTAYRACGVSKRSPSINGTYRTRAFANANCNASTSPNIWTWTQECENGWDDSTKLCKPTASECLAHNSEPGFMGVGETTRNFRSACVGGCDFRVQPGASIVSVGGVEAVSGVFEFTGDVCEVEQPVVEEEQAKNPAPQECVPVGNDATGRAYTVCMKPDGRHCYSGAPERQICWRPGETGEKADGPVLQKREVGGTPTPPSSSSPPGTTLQADGIPMTSTTTVGGNTFITTTNNYTTGGPEVDPSQPPAGEPDDGSGSPGEGEGDEGSVTGGVNCDDPPVVQGDPILANIVLQTWGTRCAAESADKVSTTGDLYDCSSSWSVSGPEGSAHVVRLQAMRDEICRRDADGNGQPDWTQGDAPPLQNEGEPGDGNEPAPPAGLTIGSDLLDMDGFLGVSTCPTLGVLDFGVFGSFDLDSEPVWCDLVAIMRAIVLMMAAFTAINILLGRE